MCLAQRNREALLRIPPLRRRSAAASRPSQLRLEYRGADASRQPLPRARRDRARRPRRACARSCRRRRSSTATRPSSSDAEAERFGVGALPASLEESLQALADDQTARGWLAPLLYDAYVSVKRAELDAAARAWTLEELCRRYAAIY